LNGDEPKRKVYKIVRKKPSLKVPRTGEFVIPEKWIMNVIFKHSTDSVGHFVKADSRWVRDSSSGIGSLLSMYGGGHTQWFEVSLDEVRVGDVIIKTDE
jgi:hypothetical protein